MSGRLKPYEKKQISGVPCARCGGPSKFQWSVCALGGYHYGVCEKCDVELNELVLKFFKAQNHGRLMHRYRREAAK